MSSLRGILNSPQRLSLTSLPQPTGTIRNRKIELNHFSNRMCDRFTVTTTSSRETTYLKEFLFVYKTWFEQIEKSLESMNTMESRRCLDGLRCLRFELNIPVVQV